MTQVKIVSEVAEVSEVLKEQGIKLYTFDFRANYSNDLSQIYFNDFKQDIENHSLWFSGRNSTDYLVIFENEALKDAPYYKKSNLAKMKKQDLYDLCVYLFGYLNFYFDDKCCNKSLLIDMLLDVTFTDYYTHHYNENSWHDLECSFVIRGYSQGEVCKVLLVGKVESYINESHLTNLFYDSPIDGKIEINLNGNYFDEINFYDLDGFDQYGYFDKDQFINMIAKYCITEEYCTLLIDYLKENVPTSLSYDY